MIIKNIGTHLKVTDFNKSLRFYEALGFKKVFEYGRDKKVKEDYNGTVFEHGGCKLEIADGHRAVKPEVFKQPITSSKVSLMVNIDSISELIKTAKDAGIKLAVGPRHYYWGTIEVVIKDPDGLILVFIGPYSEKEAEKVGADETWAKLP